MLRLPKYGDIINIPLPKTGDSTQLLLKLDVVLPHQSEVKISGIDANEDAGANELASIMTDERTRLLVGARYGAWLNWLAQNVSGEMQLNDMRMLAGDLSKETIE